MSLVHTTRLEVENYHLGQTGYRLLDNKGNYIEGFDRFSKFLIEQGRSFYTRKRYSEAVSRFIDYLFEVKVLAHDATNVEINQAVNVYPILLRDGSNIKDASPEKAIALKKYAEAVGMKNGLARKSFTPSIAAINCFLRVAQALALEAIAKARLYNKHPIPNDCEVFIEAINGLTALSSFEKERMKQDSILGAVMRLHGEIKRPRGLRSPIRNEKQIDLDRLDFPLHQFPKLIEEAPSYRDKTLYCLLGGGGIRLHEGLQLDLSHIDVENRTVYVIDPNSHRFGNQMTKEEKLRFKGRITSRTFLFEPLKSEFFKWLELYLRHEFVPTDNHNFLFQKLDRQDRGNPLKDASHTALNNAFKSAVARAEINGPDIMPDYVWTLHSLRHMYGVYMLNYIPVPGGFGLLPSEVQMLMGHKSINSTRHYARHDNILLKAKLEAADRMIIDGGFDIHSFPDLIANRLIAEAQKYRRLGGKKDDQ
jgi:integrase